jgi:hypothetical protein
MQSILGIDLSCQPCELTLCNIEGAHIEVVERATVRLPLFSDKDALRSDKLLSASSSVVKEREPTEGENLDKVNGENGAASPYSEVVEQTARDLRDAIASLGQSWTATAVILPQHDFLGLNLDLPFNDPKNLDRIVDLEVQDVVPFELESFFVQYAPLAPAAGGSNLAQAVEPSRGHDVHIGMLPRVVVRNVLEVCKRAGLEPNILTVPSSAIGAAYHVAKDALEGNSAVVYNRGDEYSIAIYINGEVRVERSVYASQVLSAVSPGKREDNLQHIFTALKLIIASAERRYNARVEKVYLLGREVKAANATQLFGRPLEGLPLTELFSANGKIAGIAPLTAVFAQDDAAAAPLSNFRSREFSFTPRVSEFIRALMGTRRHILRATMAVIAAGLVVYGSRAFLLYSSQKSLITHIQRVIPSFESEPSKVRENLSKAEGKLADELGAFGSRSKLSPADAFLQIVKSVPSSGEISITSLRVSGVRAQIAGSGSDLSATERFKKSIESQRETFSKVELKTSPVGGKFNFTLDVALAQ